LAHTRKIHNAADSLTTAGLRESYTKDTELRFANNEPVVGLDAIVQFFENIFPLLASMKHDIIDFGISLSLCLTLTKQTYKIKDVAGNKIYLTCTITYVVKGDLKKEKFVIPTLGVYCLEESGELKRFEVYIDIGPVMARVGEVHAS